MPSAPRALIIRSPGTNCDGELLRAFTLAGAQAELIHLDRLIESPSHLDSAQILAIAGGFSYGDDLGAGRVMAVRIRERLYPALRDAVDRGVLIFGVCNGFQALVQTGLLPGSEPGAWPERPAPQTIALAPNEGARFIDSWLRIEAVPDSVCVWTKGLATRASTSAGDKQSDPAMMLPIAHGEGRFIAADARTIEALERRHQVALRYLENANGSQGAIAGICDPSGRVFGLMPHPERYLEWNRHPFWTALAPEQRTGDTPGLRIFKNAVAAARDPARIPARPALV